MEYEKVIIAINNLKTITNYASCDPIDDLCELDYANCGIDDDPVDDAIGDIIEIANSFGFSYTEENFESIELYYENIKKLKNEIISIIVSNINSLDNTKLTYWKIYRDFKLHFPNIKVQIPNLTEEEKNNGKKKK